MAGKDFLHGPHQEAQKSSRITWPLRVSGSLPSSLNEARLGSASPSLSAAGDACASKASASTLITMHFLCSDRNMAGEPPGLVTGRVGGDAGLDALRAVAMDQVESL